MKLRTVRPDVFFNDTATTEIYTLSPTRRSSDLDALALIPPERRPVAVLAGYPTPHEDELRERARPIAADVRFVGWRSEEHTSELQSRQYLVCRLLLEKQKPCHRCRGGRPPRRSP